MTNAPVGTAPCPTRLAQSRELWGRFAFFQIAIGENLDAKIHMVPNDLLHSHSDLTLLVSAMAPEEAFAFALRIAIEPS